MQATWPNSRLLLCDFCREQDWLRWLDSVENGAVQHRKQEVLGHLRQIADAYSQEDLDRAQHRFVYSRLYLECVPLQVYYTEHYLQHLERWVQFYRHGLHTRLDASNAHERREGLMRKHYQQPAVSSPTLNVVMVMSSVKQTADAMWHDYWKANAAQVTPGADSHGLEEPVRHLVNRPHGFCHMQMKAYQKAKRFLQLCAADVALHVLRSEGDAPDTFLVKELGSAGGGGEKWHRLELSPPDGEPSCSCSAFHKHRMPCQHFYAVFAAFDDVSWLSLPASYRNAAVFILDERCAQLPADDGGPVAQSGGSEPTERSANISRLTGLLDKIKASAGSVDDHSLTTCVRQVEAAASFVEHASPSTRRSDDAEGPLSDSVEERS